MTSGALEGLSVLEMGSLVAAPYWKIKQAKHILAGPKSCMEGID